MANPKGPTESSFPFSGIPEDIQLRILSILSPPDIAHFASTSKRFVSLCRNDTKLWFTMCHRRWGSMTHISKWGCGNITYKLLYKTLTRWENLIGFWRHCGRADLSGHCPRFIVFEWGPSFVSGSRVNDTYHIIKSPFLWMGISSDGQIVNFLDLEGQTDVPTGGFDCWLDSVCSDQNLVPVTLNFMVGSPGAYRTVWCRKCTHILQIGQVRVGINHGGGRGRRRRKDKGGGNGSLNTFLNLLIACLLEIGLCRVFERWVEKSWFMSSKFKG